MILKVGRAAIAHDVLVFIRPVSILFAQLIVPYPAYSPVKSSPQRMTAVPACHCLQKRDGSKKFVPPLLFIRIPAAAPALLQAWQRLSDSRHVIDSQCFTNPSSDSKKSS